ncbi:hypothetical protein PQR02_09565 [Paraburkholderia sediminicola]|uniref:Uncharacterized protein n=1 Tax=Paraburkholderia rhynchosiae TaxID=487049 RepID=A0ACC7NKA9_9BURK
MFYWQLYIRSLDFWASVYLPLFCGWLSLLFAALTVWQIKPIRRIINHPPFGVFMIGVSAFSYQDARNTTVTVLNRHFPFAVSQLVQAVDTGTRLLLALDIALFLFVVLAGSWIALVVCDFAPGGRDRWPLNRGFYTACFGALLSMLTVFGCSVDIVRSFGGEVILVRAAYELDFTSQFNCEGVPDGARVLLSKISDNIGYAVKLSFPNRPFLRMKEMDKDLAGSMPSPASYRVVACNKVSPTRGQ